MGSQSDDETGNVPRAQKKGHVVEDERGHRVWKDTIRSLKLTLMETGRIFMSKKQHRLMELREADTDAPPDDLDDDLEVIDDGGGFDPYDSAKK